jgi:hypothetical protein
MASFTKSHIPVANLLFFWLRQHEELSDIITEIHSDCLVGRSFAGAPFLCVPSVAGATSPGAVFIHSCIGFIERVAAFTKEFRLIVCRGAVWVARQSM